MRYKLTILPNNETLYVEESSSLREGLLKSGYSVPSPCGGKGTCGKCLVKLLRGTVGGTSPDDLGRILACRATVQSDLTVEIEPIAGDGNCRFEEKQTGSPQNGAGVILDIGTTTLAACLIDLKSGKIKSKRSALNRQGSYGADVISRIEAFQNGHGKTLQTLILDATRELLTDFQSETEDSLQELVVVANTTMLHLFLGIDPSSIGTYPFVPSFTEAQTIPGDRLSLPVQTVRLLPSVSAYVGADIIAGILACVLDSGNTTRLFADIGTNGELVLAHHGRLYATTTAAGPALEGADIECGTGGIAGAIHRVILSGGKLQCDTIHHAPINGLCGSGLIDLIAILRKEGLIDENGLWDPDADSFLTQYRRGDRFYLTDTVYLSQADIHQFQLAKAAISAGIDTLLSTCNISAQEVQTFFVAGGLGDALNLHNAAAVGLFPSALSDCTKSVGNTALAGAAIYLSEEKSRKRAARIASQTKAIDLALSTSFQKAYIQAMRFPALHAPEEPIQ